MFEEKKDRLIKNLIAKGYISNKEVIRAMKRVPREIFIPEDQRQFAYSDTPLRIGDGQTISAPHMVGMMLELLELKVGHKVLEIGGGSGYHAAMAASIIGHDGHVYTVEVIEDLAKKAEANIREAGLIGRASVIHADGSKGLKRFAPFDRIMVACGAPSIPGPLVDQLKEGGIMILPIGSEHYQNLIRVIKKPGGAVISENHGGCAFVPMIGEFGFEKLLL